MGCWKAENDNFHAPKLHKHIKKQLNPAQAKFLNNSLSYIQKFKILFSIYLLHIQKIKKLWMVENVDRF